MVLSFTQYILQLGVTDNNIVNGAMTAMGPVVDYIKFDYSGNDKLSWKPVYDNIDGKAS